MIYLKEFSTENDYLTYRNDKSKYLKPNVSLCDDNGSVFYNFTPPIVYEAVDLGLPSGTKWATMNVGASKPSDAGLYFQWGDTSGYTADQVGTGSGQKNFAWADYKFGAYPNFSKYTTTGATLELADDAAHINMGGDWHMPTPKQIQELISNTDTGWTISNGTGMTFTSKSDPSKSIFVPAAGSAWDGSVYGSRRYGGVWSSMLCAGAVNLGQDLYFDAGAVNLGQDRYFGSDDANLANNNRCEGLSVRGVLG